MADARQLTIATARRHARWLCDNRYQAVQVVESFPYGDVFVRYENRCGMARTIRTEAEFLAVRDATR